MSPLQHGQEATVIAGEKAHHQCLLLGSVFFGKKKKPSFFLAVISRGSQHLLLEAKDLICVGIGKCSYCLLDGNFPVSSKHFIF